MYIYISNIHDTYHKTSEILWSQGSRMGILHIINHTPPHKQIRMMRLKTCQFIWDPCRLSCEYEQIRMDFLVNMSMDQPTLRYRLP
jgi:hypothetical protein